MSLSTSSPLPPTQSSALVSTRNDITGLVELRSSYRIATGGFGDIFEGHHKQYGKVALKRPHDILDSTTVHRFVQEVEMWCSVSHQYILACFGLCKIGLDFYCASPFVEKGDLMACIREGRPFDRRKLLHQVAQALAHLHECGIVHGDVKGSNILLSNDGTALLCDFGLAKVSGMKTSTTEKGAGSIRWMAPELLVDEGSRTTESDTYSFGITIAEVLSGQTPFHDIQTNHGVANYVQQYNGRPLTDPIADRDGTSYEGLWSIAEKCWASSATDRPSMAQVSVNTAFCSSELEAIGIETQTDSDPPILCREYDISRIRNVTKLYVHCRVHRRFSHGPIYPCFHSTTYVSRYGKRRYEVSILYRDVRYVFPRNPRFEDAWAAWDQLCARLLRDWSRTYIELWD